MQLFANNAFSTLSSAAGSTDVVLSVVNGSGFPAPTGDDFFLATLIGFDGTGQENAWEIVKCTARSGNDLTVVRGQEGTTAVAWDSASWIQLRVTSGTLTGFQKETWTTLTGTTPSITAGSHTWTLTGASTPTDGLSDGDHCTLMIDDGSASTINWASVVDQWLGGEAPELPTTGYAVVVLWKQGTTVYAVHAGDAS